MTLSMKFGRILLYILASLLFISSSARSFQVSKRAAAVTQAAGQAQKLIVKPIPLPASSHRSETSHINFPRKRFSVQAPVVRFTFGKSASIICAHQTSVSATGGSVSISLDIGKPEVTPVNELVKNAPGGMTFSKVTWPMSSSFLPSGLMFTASEGSGQEYPVLTISFAVPAGATNIIPTVTAARSTPIGNVNFLPQQQKIKGSLARIFDPKTYSIEPKVTVLKPQVFRSLRMVTLRVPLIRGTNALQSFTVGIRYSTKTAQPQGTVRDPLFMEMERRLVANPYDVGRFAIPLRPARSKASMSSAKNSHALSVSVGFDSVYTWIDPNAEYVRMAVTRDGLYRVSVTDLNFPSAGFTVASAGWAAKNLRCINHGKEIPLWIDTDANGNIAAIEFYGEHLRGFPLPTDTLSPFNNEKQLPEYYNLATDTNVYWLTSSNKSGGQPPLRYTLRTPNPTGAPVLATGNVLLHHERDLNYFLGDPVSSTVETQERTEYVAGERFVWFNFDGLSNDSSVRQMFDTFYIAKLPADTAGQLALLKFRLRGTAEDLTDTSDNPHRAEIFVNGKLEGDDIFLNFNYDLLQIQVPLSNLIRGPNILRVFAGPSGAQTIDQWYLDYYEVSFPGALYPSVDTGIANGQWLFQESSGMSTYQLALSDPAAHLYNLTDGTRIAPQAGSFVDSPISSNPLYAAATPASLLHCANIRPWNAPNSPGWGILNAGQTTDYIVITDDTFMRAAKELALRRAGQGLKPLVVTTDEVFNAFDYGSNEPEAIRRFLNFAYFNYSSVPAGLVTLLGNASWDPKFNLAGSTKHSFVPTYGNPVSDFYFTLAEDSSLDSAPLMLISRIPASTEIDAENYINKLVEYEDDPPAAWNRKVLFLAGGQQGVEHDVFHQQEQTYISMLSTPPADAQGSIIDRTDFNSGVDALHVGEIEDSLQSGKAIMYFGGHGATFTSDILFPEASTLHNKGLYPLLITLTCRTGAFAEGDQIGINESYIDAVEAGSVQAYGTTGFGNQDLDDLITRKYFQLVQFSDSTLDTTQPQTINSLALLTAAKFYATPFSYYGHNEELQLSMLGDAATGFILRPQPEFAVYSNEVHGYSGNDTVPRTSLSVSDSIMTIRALVHNYGFAADRPVVVRITDAGPSGLPFVINDTLPRLDSSAFVSVSFPLSSQSVGTHEISIVIDPDHRFPESYRADDYASIQVLVNALSTTAFYPYEGSRGLCDIGPTTVHFIVLTPAGFGSGDQVELEIDTTQKFSNIFVDQKKSIGTSYYVIFDISLPAAPVPWSTIYCWRSRVVRANGDTTDWQYATFSTASASRPEFSYTSSEQLDSTIVSGLSLNAQGMLYLPTQDTEFITFHSYGENDVTQPYSQISINGNSVYEDGLEGVAIVLFTPDGTQIDTAYEFDMPWPDFLGNASLQDSAAHIFDSVIASLLPNRRVAILTVGQMDFQNFIDSTHAQMQTLGSLNGLNPPYNGSYALLGKKGLAPGSAKESNAQNGTKGTFIFDTIISSGTSGLAQTPFTAISKDYGSLIWTGNPVPGGTDIMFSVLGSRRDGTGTDVVETFNASSGNSFSLSNINPRVYDRLAVRMNFVRTSNATASPALSGIQLQYDAAPELLFAMDSIQIAPKLVNSGAVVIGNYTVSTLTCSLADSVPLIVTRQYQNRIDTVATHFIAILAGHASQPFTDSVSTVNELGNVALTAIVNPNDAVNEQLLFNNSIGGTYVVTRDTTKPSIQILFDDRNIPNGGYVSSNATIQINLISTNPLRDTSHSSIVAATLVNINNPAETYSIGYYSYPAGFPQPEFESFSNSPGPLQAFLRFKPNSPYPAGTWVLTAAVTDASGNTDTLQQQFTISSTNGLEHVMNYPNPFKDKTDFTFILRNDNPVDVKIIVYTIAGRKIRTLTPIETHAGFNAVEWDGRDERGNDVADGTYLYRVIINGKNGDNTSDAVTERAVKDR